MDSNELEYLVRDARIRFKFWSCQILTLLIPALRNEAKLDMILKEHDDSVKHGLVRVLAVLCNDDDIEVAGTSRGMCIQIVEKLATKFY